MKTWQAIINPTAGGGKAGKLWPKLLDQARSRGFTFDPHLTERPGHAAQIATELIDKGYGSIITVGGDGTHHEVVNGVMRSSVSHTCTLGVIPIGTGNDWARTLGIRNRSDAIRIIAEGHSTLHHVGVVELNDDRTEFFMNVVGMCLDAEVITRISRKLMRRLGIGAYLLGGLKALHSHRPYTGSVTLDEHSIEDHLVTIHVGLGKYCGGGMQFTPHAARRRNDLAVTLIHHTSKLNLLRNIHRLYFNSIEKFRLATLTHSETVRVVHLNERPIPIEADGEYLGLTPCLIRCLPNALKVVVPRERF